jgi:hypothetical protein
LLCFAVIGVSSPSADAAVGVPTVTGPIGSAGLWGHALWDSWFELRDIGYTEDEFFVSGEAANAAGQRAPYTTRIIVNRPIKQSRFNGTVVLDWVNVTAQFENAVDSIAAHELLFREGFAFVHVSAQAAGICCTPLTPKVWDPVRYAALDHPGDAYVDDIFSQVARAFGTRRGVDPMKGLKVRRVLAAGQSQSAIRLDSYVRQTQRRARVIDGFLIHGGGSKRYDPPPQVPVVHLLSDLEASTEKPNTSKNYRLWEIAGSSHSDFWTGYHQEFGQGPRSLLHAAKQPASADAEMHTVAGNYGESVHPMEATCILAGATFPMRYAVSAALHHLNRWVTGGKPPPTGPRFRFNGGVLAGDEYGNTLGGIRLPPIDVPVAHYVSTACGLGGITVPFSDTQLHELYPTHADYFARMRKAARVAMKARFLLPPDAKDLLERACSARVRWDSGSAGAC